MKHDDRQLGKPQFIFKDTQANINLLTGSNMEGEVAYATDTGLLGHCVGNSWVWEREVLNANRTYYVSTGGNDSNNGLTSGGAFLTIQKAVNVAASLDCLTYNVNIQVADGTYNSAAIQLRPLLGSGELTIRGNSATPANVKIVSSTTGFSSSLGGLFTIRDLEISVASGYYCIAAYLGRILYRGVQFTSVAGFGAHLLASGQGVISCTGNYTITGSAMAHLYATGGGVISLFSYTVTLTGTPAWSTAFALSDSASKILTNAVTFSGAATGSRYNCNTNGVIQSYGSGASYFPGDSAGTVATGGQYA